MSKVVFFNIPAYGHTNPTIEVVRELSNRGNKVWYYSFNEFKEKIENAGAVFISCDAYLPKLRRKDKKRMGKDFSALIRLVSDMTIALDKKVCKELEDIKPDCVVYDSICIWGRLFAEKLKIPYVCSTTTFAFNVHSAKLMKRGFSEIMYIILGMRLINKKVKQLRDKGYDVENVLSLVQNSNDINTIVYTSKEFQPMADTFSDKYYFIGPSVTNITVENDERKRRRIYISLGTVLNKNIKFYKNCIKALGNCDIDVIMSIGKNISVSELEDIPDNFQVKNKVEQIKVLQNVDAFITHCGMNSANESLYYGVPMILYPRQSEQGLVAERVSELGAGFILKKNDPKYIKEAVFEVLNNNNYKKNAERLKESFRSSGGYKEGADVILGSIKNLQNEFK